VDDFIQFQIDIAGDSLDYGQIEYMGNIEDISEEGVLIYPTNLDKSGYGDGYSFDFSESFYEESGDLTVIDPRTITSIYYQSNGASAVSTVSGILAAAGYTTAMLIAPLISINYRTGDFNESRYYKVAGYSLITVGLTLPIAILTSGRTFEFKDLFENDEYDDGWEFDF
ncbi:hypothetical protein ACFLQX_00005, partial [Bacteroidota bacterium]